MSEMVEDATYRTGATAVTVITVTVVPVSTAMSVVTVPAVMVVPVVVSHLLQVGDGRLRDDSSHRQGECGRAHQGGCAEDHGTQDSRNNVLHLGFLQYQLPSLNVMSEIKFLVSILGG